VSITSQRTPTTTNTEVGAVQVNAGSYTDHVGNAGGASNTVTFTGDTQAPTVTLSADNTTVLAGQTATVTFTFSDPNPTFSVFDVQVAGGSLGNNLVHVGINGAGQDVYTAILTPAASDHDVTSVSVPSAIYSDAAGNLNEASNTLSIGGDTLAPTAPTLALLYKADGAAVFSASVPVFATDGSQDGVHTVSVEEIDAGGNASPVSSLTFTLDTTAPQLTGITASPGSGSAMTGSTVQLTLGFNEAVNVSGGTPTLTLNDGGSAVYDAAATMTLGDSSKFVFDHVVSATDQTSALAVTGFAANGADVSDLAGNHPDLSSVSAAFDALQINETTAAAYTVGGITRPRRLASAPHSA